MVLELDVFSIFLSQLEEALYKMIGTRLILSALFSGTDDKMGANPSSRNRLRVLVLLSSMKEESGIILRAKALDFGGWVVEFPTSLGITCRFPTKKTPQFSIQLLVHLKHPINDPTFVMSSPTLSPWFQTGSVFQMTGGPF